MRKLFEDEIIVEAYKKYGTCEEAAKTLGCSSETVRRALIRNSIPRTKSKGGNSKREKTSRKKYYYYKPVRYEKVCECCGEEFVSHRKNQQCCSKRCKMTLYNYKTGRSPNSSPFEIEKVCIICGKTFSTRREAVLTCSSECSRIRHNTNGRKKQKKSCVICGKEYETSRKDRKTCGSNECQKRLDLIRYKRNKSPAIKSVPKKCVICGEEFKDYPNGTAKTCSHECSKELEREKRREHAHDKRVPKEQRVDRISLKKLYKRDNGICYICGKACDWTDWRVSKSGNKYPGDTYPTKEHVDPISRGGLDSWENVRLAHWKCNIEKADAVIRMQPMSKAFAYSEKYVQVKKKTEQYTLDGELIKVWESTADIKRTLGLNDKRIQDVCRGEGKTAFGYIWKYA